MSQNVNLLFTKNCLIPCNLEIGRKSQKGSDETVLHVLPWACLFLSPSLRCHRVTAMKVKWASTPQSPEPLSMQPIQPPTQPPMSEEILFRDEVDPLGSVSERQPGIFCILNWTVIKPFWQIQFQCISLCACVCTHIHFLTQIGWFYPEELIACPIDSKPLRGGGSDRWKDHSIMESVLGLTSGDRLSNPACTTNLLCDLRWLT